jgi:hypothetical protein
MRSLCTKRVGLAALICVLACQANAGPLETDEGSVNEQGSNSNRPSNSQTQPSAPTCRYPSCVLDVIEHCLTETPCVEPESRRRNAQSGTLEEITCYANGVKAVTTFSLPRQEVVTTVFKPNGTPCYSYARQGDTAVMTSDWWDPTGAVFATSTADRRTFEQTISCPDGEALTWRISGEDCDPLTPGMTAPLVSYPSCETGACEPPPQTAP